MRPTWMIAVAALMVIPGALVAQAPPPARLRGLDTYIERAMRDWEVPGLAIAVVKDDSVVWARGFGVRELGRPDRVDEHTTFVAASTTKAFTAALMGMLVDSQRVRWDDPVTRHLPWFQLYDPYATREMTVRDLLSHRGGLTRADGTWYASGRSRTDIVRAMRFHPPRWSFRSRYGYQNVMFLTAGEVIAAVSGRSWDDVIRERLLVPLGMTHATTTVRDLPGMDNVAMPHARVERRMVAVPWRNVDNVAAAGSLNASVFAMAQWVRLNLGRGMYGGRRLVSEAVIREMQTAHTVITSNARTDSIWPDVHLRAYGLGWSLNDYRGRKVVSHGGALDGMRSHVAMLPEERLGVVVMANSDQVGALLVGLAYRVFDAYLGASQARDWSADLLADLQWSRRRADSLDRRRDSLRVRDTRTSTALAGYAGRYADSLYGEADVTVDGEHLVVHTGELVGDLEHWHYDTFRVAWRQRHLGRSFAEFAVGFDGRVARLTLRDDEEDLDLQTYGRVRTARGAAAGSP